MAKSTALLTLLQQAAVAANRSGLTIIDTEAGPQILKSVSAGSEVYEIWAPHESDAEAFRLAVALHLFRGYQNLFADEIVGKPNDEKETRMAILRAAAKMGSLLLSYETTN